MASSTSSGRDNDNRPSVRDVIYCMISISLGTYIMMTDMSGFYGSSGDPTSAAASRSSTAQLWMESCSQISELPSFVLEEEGLFDHITTEHPTLTMYDTKFSLGLKVYNVAICFFTQFVNELTTATTSPAGCLAWMTTVLIWLPLAVLMRIESFRDDAVGLAKYPTILYLSCQLSSGGLFFRSFWVPLIWIPAWILGRGRDSTISKVQQTLVLPVVVLPNLVLSILMFAIHNSSSSSDTNTNLWSAIVGLLGGPVLPLLNGIVFCIVAAQQASKKGQVTISPINKSVAKLTQESNHRSSMVYAMTGIIALFGWLWVLLIQTLPVFGFNFQAIYNAIWVTTESVAIQFMTLEALVLWSSALLVLAYINERAAIEGVFMSFLFGPGAGVALVLAGLCVDDDTQLHFMSSKSVKK